MSENESNSEENAFQRFPQLVGPSTSAETVSSESQIVDPISSRRTAFENQNSIIDTQLTTTFANDTSNNNDSDGSSLDSFNFLVNNQERRLPQSYSRLLFPDTNEVELSDSADTYFSDDSFVVSDSTLYVDSDSSTSEVLSSAQGSNESEENLSENEPIVTMSTNQNSTSTALTMSTANQSLSPSLSVNFSTVTAVSTTVLTTNTVSSSHIHVDLTTASCTPPNRSKRKMSSPESNDFKKTLISMPASQGDSDDSMCCSICFESWTNSGNHRLTSLKCGHIFGKICIEKWLKESAKCPQCNAKAKKSDLRVIYAKKLVTLDTVDLDHAMKEADKERKEKRECEMELAKVRMQYHMSVEECERLKLQVSSLKMQLTAFKESSLQVNESTPTTSSSNSLKGKKFYRLLKDSVITQSGGCRVMDFHPKTQQFVVSQPSPHATFVTGFGVKRLSACDLKGGYFTLLHQKAIKDLSFSPLTDHHVLSASQDGTLRITDLMSNAKIHEYKVGKPVWSCCWDVKDRNVIYAGLSNGSIMQYDLRNTAERLSTVENANSMCPVVSLYHVPPTAGDHFQGRGGLLTGTLDGALFWQDTGSRDNEGPSLIADFKPVFLPLESGSCTGVQYCPKTHCFLTTFRPGRSYRSTTHLLCELKCHSSDTDNSRVTCNILDKYTGGQSHKMLTRNSIFVLPENLNSSSDVNLLACVGDEALRKVQIYDSSQNSLFQSLSVNGGLPLDILPVHINDTPPKLAVLSQNNLQLFQLT